MNENLFILTEKYLNGEASEAEREQVDAWYHSFESNPGLTARLTPAETVRTMAENFAQLSGKLDFH